MTKLMKLFLMLVVFNITTEIKADQLDTMIDMSINQIKQDPNINEMTDCLNVSQSKFLNAFRKTMRYCFDKHDFSDQAENAMNDCMDRQLQQNRIGRAQPRLNPMLDKPQL